MQNPAPGDDGDGGDAVAFSVAPLRDGRSGAAARNTSVAGGDGAGPWEGAVVLSLRVESKSRAECGGGWVRVQEDLVALHEVNVVTKLDRANHAYRISLWPASSSDEWGVAFPFYLRVPLSNSGDSLDGGIAPPHIGTFAIDRGLGEFTPTPMVAEEDQIQDQAAGFICGTLVLALLKRQRTKEEMEPRSATYTLRSERPAEGAGSASTDEVAELPMAAFPEVHDDRGWRDFFDSHIYRPEKQHAPDRSATRRGSDDDFPEKASAPALRANRVHHDNHLDGVRPRSSGRETAREIKERIDREAMEAAIDDAECFFEFWQM